MKKLVSSFPPDIWNNIRSFLSDKDKIKSIGVEKSNVLMLNEIKDLKISPVVNEYTNHSYVNKFTIIHLMKKNVKNIRKMTGFSNQVIGTTCLELSLPPNEEHFGIFSPTFLITVEKLKINRILWIKFHFLKNIKVISFYGITFSETNNISWSDEKLKLKELSFIKCLFKIISNHSIESIDELNVLHCKGSDIPLRSIIEKSKKILIDSDEITIDEDWLKNGGENNVLINDKTQNFF